MELDFTQLADKISKELNHVLEEKKELSRMNKYENLRAQIERDNKEIEEALECDHRKQRGRTAPNRALCCDECCYEDDEFIKYVENLEYENELLKEIIIGLLKDIYA